MPNNAAKFTYSVAQHGNFLFMTSLYVLSDVIFRPDQYASLREFRSQVLSKEAEVIVFVKKP
jgi:hypothetical protein